MQHALRQEKSEEKRQSISLLISIIQLPRTVFQEYTINTVNTKLLHQNFVFSLPESKTQCYLLQFLQLTAPYNLNSAPDEYCN